MKEEELDIEAWKAKAWEAFASQDKETGGRLIYHTEFSREFPCGIECCGMEGGPLKEWSEKVGILEFLLECD
jgi:hypothetical protein